MKQKNESGLSVLDRYVKFNLKMIKGEMTGGLSAAVLAGLAIYMDPFIGSILSVVISMIILVCMISCIKKLFYSTVFAGDAAIYNMLPISYAEMVVTKVLTAVLCIYIPYAIYVFIAGSILPSPKDYDVTIFMFLSGSKLPETATAMLDTALRMAGDVCNMFGEIPLIFLGITVYNTLPQASRTGGKMFLLAAAVLAGASAPNWIGMLLTRLQVSGAVTYVVRLLLSLAIGIASCIATRRRLERRYFLG